MGRRRSHRPGDPTDMEREIEKMTSIYGGSHFTIVAANATSSHEGFLQERKTTQFQPISFDSKLHPEISGNLYLEICKPDLYTECQSRGAYETQIKNSHWNTRGWTFQEGRIPNRAIYFGSSAVHFRCNFNYRCDMFTGLFQAQHHWLPIINVSLQSPDADDDTSELSKPTDKSLNSWWYSWVTEFLFLSLFTIL